MSCGDKLNDNVNPTVIVQGATQVTLTPSQELVTPGTVQVYPNSEFAQAFPASKAVTQTVLTIPPHTPGAA
jgi:hypothetical protein